MSATTFAFATKDALSEIRSVCPDVTNTFIFGENGEIIAKDQETSEYTINKTYEAFEAIAEKANPVGRIESVTFRGEKAKANITRYNEYYTASVFSNNADEKTVANLTRVMIPTILKLVRDVAPHEDHPSFAPQKANLGKTSIPQSYIAKDQLNRFKVENIGFSSFLNSPNLVQVDSALIAQWKEIYGDKPITQIIIEDPNTNRTLTCEFKPFKESKYEGKGIILLSEKTQLVLRVQKGTEIIVKPVIGTSENSNPTLNAKSLGSEKPKIAQPKQTTAKSESFAPTAPTSQFIVENLKGFGSYIGNNEFARIDPAVIARWKEIFGKKEIVQVEVEETASGRHLTCKYKPITDQNLEGKGIIQLSEKIQQALQTKKGALVVVKPKVE